MNKEKLERLKDLAFLMKERTALQGEVRIERGHVDPKDGEQVFSVLLPAGLTPATLDLFKQHVLKGTDDWKSHCLFEIDTALDSMLEELWTKRGCGELRREDGTKLTF